MVIGLVLAVAIARGTRKDGTRVSAYAGLLAGLVAGSAFAVTQIAASKAQNNSFVEGFDFNPFALIAGLLIGLGLPYAVIYLPQAPGLVGLVTLILSASSSLALFNYLFNGSARDFTMLLAMSLLFGVLVWLVFNGEKLDEIKDISCYVAWPWSIEWLHMRRHDRPVGRTLRTSVLEVIGQDRTST
jgi:hypothetical protein